MSVPEATTRILLYGEGGDLYTTRISVVAVRRPYGGWHTSVVSERQLWIPDTDPDIFPQVERDLSADDSRRLDTLLRDRCLYAGPTSLRPRESIVGGLFGTLEVLVPSKRWSGSWYAVPTEQVAKIISLIDPPRAEPRSN